MKRLLPAILLAASASYGATTTTWPSLAAGALPDTEVTVERTLALNRDKLQEVSFSLDAENCTANEVVFAIGYDEDGDGNLSLDETDLYIGNDCGEKYLVDCNTGEVATGIDTVKVKARNINPDWDKMLFIKRGTATLSESASMTTENKMFVIRIR